MMDSQLLEQADFLLAHPCHMTADTSAASGVPPDGTVAAVAFFPFSGGMSKTSLFPPTTPFHRPKSFPSSSVHVNAPTHGWTFHPTSSVTLLRPDMTSLISVI